MSVPHEHPVRLLLPGRHYVISALEFEGLYPAEGEGAGILRFRHTHETTLDVPVSGEALSFLERSLRHLEGKLPEEMESEILGLSDGGFLPGKPV